jgi:arylsulfatase A-like enzyme
VHHQKEERAWSQDQVRGKSEDGITQNCEGLKRRDLAGKVSHEMVHCVDVFPTLARIAGAAVPQDRAIDGVDQTEFFLGKQEKSNREGFPVYVGDILMAVKWRNWKVLLSFG